MDSDLQKLMGLAEKCFSSEDNKAFGRQAEVKSLMEEKIREKVVLLEGGVLPPLQGKHGDGEVAFYFDMRGDAEDLYDFLLETQMVIPGEIRFDATEAKYSVHLTSEVVMNKPEVVHAAIMAYEHQLEDGYEEYAESISELVRAREEMSEGKKVSVSKLESGSIFVGARRVRNDSIFEDEDGVGDTLARVFKKYRSDKRNPICQGYDQEDFAGIYETQEYLKNAPRLLK
jgi:hypothetical protein